MSVRDNRARYILAPSHGPTWDPTILRVGTVGCVVSSWECYVDFPQSDSVLRQAPWDVGSRAGLRGGVIRWWGGADRSADQTVIPSLITFLITAVSLAVLGS